MKRRLDLESRYWTLILSGVGTVEACRIVGIGRRTGYRWRGEKAIALWNQAQAATQHAQAQHEQAVAQATATGQPVPTFADPGAATRQAAQDTLNRARAQLTEVGDTVSGAIQDATSEAPRDDVWTGFANCSLVRTLGSSNLHFQARPAHPANGRRGA